MTAEAIGGRRLEARVVRHLFGRNANAGITKKPRMKRSGGKRQRNHEQTEDANHSQNGMMGLRHARASPAQAFIDYARGQFQRIVKKCRISFWSNMGGFSCCSTPRAPSSSWEPAPIIS